MSDILPQNPFDALRRFQPDGSEFWSARELQAALGYVEWRKFNDAMERARLSCENVGHDSDDHFGEAAKMVEIGSKAEREVADFHLSRYACYLTAMNGDPRKNEIALAQAYFASMTRRAEVAAVGNPNAAGTPALISARQIGIGLGIKPKHASMKAQRAGIHPTHHCFEPRCRAAAYLYPLDEVEAYWPRFSFPAFNGQALPGIGPVSLAVSNIKHGKIARQHQPRLIPTDSSAEQLARRLLSLEAQKREVLRELGALA